MNNSYFLNNGKYQELAESLNECIPDFGYTANKEINLYIAISGIYKDAYSNLVTIEKKSYQDDFERYIKPCFPELQYQVLTPPKNGKKADDWDRYLRRLENVMDMTLEYLKGKRIEFPIHKVWVTETEDKTCFSQRPPKGKLAKQYQWNAVTFGSRADLDAWCRNHRMFALDVTQRLSDSKKNLEDLIGAADQKSTLKQKNNVSELVR